ncbi:MAG: hypothetical protein AUI21_03585 [Nitrospirae bacterium 13_1_40CM_2_62_10]|nr:MAG: hypothetical protein AUI21_03585 [Nitrospirae bacterium 13_1_40CM_2_62_10]
MWRPADATLSKPRRKRRKHVPPSRLRYEAENPVVSFRVSKDVKERLMRERSSSSRSLEAILVRGLDSERLEKETYRRGDRDGFLRAFGRLAVPCYVCNKPVVVNVAEPEIKKLILGNLIGRFRHRGCQEQTGRWA